MATSTTSSIGSDILSSMSIGTFDPKSIATALATAEVAGSKAKLTDNKTANDNRLTAYTNLSNALQGLKLGLSDLAKPTSFSKFSMGSTDEAIVSATATGSPASGVYDLTIAKRAKSHTVASAPQVSQYSTLGTGVMTLNVGGSEKEITIDENNNTLAGIKNAINTSGAAVNASIINDGTGYRLVLSGKETGKSNDITVSVTDNESGDDASGLDLTQLMGSSWTKSDGATVAAYSGFEKISIADDAEYTLNGMTLTSSTNQIKGVIPDVSFNLNKVGSATLNISKTYENASENIKSVVEDFNSMKSVLDNFGALDKSATDATRGALAGDSTLTMIRSQLRNMLNFRISDPTASIQTMADIGFKTNRDGTLALDESMLNSALETNPDGVARLFASVGKPSDPLVTFTAATDKTVAGDYTLDVTQAASQAKYVGAVMTGSVIVPDADNTDPDNPIYFNKFKVNVNGVESNELSLTAGTYTDANFIKMLQNVINNDGNIKAKGHSVVATINADGALELTTDQYGSSSKISFSSDTAFSVQLENKPVEAVDGTELGATVTVAAGSTFSFNYKDTTGADQTLTGVTVPTGSGIARSTFVTSLQTAINDQLTAQALLLPAGQGRAQNIAISLDADNKIVIKNADNSDPTDFSFDQALAITTTQDTPESITTGDSVVGTDVLGSLSNGINSFTFLGVGQHVKINSILTGAPKGLEFDVLGSVTGDRGTISYAKGYAGGLSEVIDGILAKSTGLIDRKVSTITKQSTDITSQLTKLDERYNAQLQKYIYQFGMVNSLQNQMTALSTSLTSMFSSSSSDN